MKLLIVSDTHGDTIEFDKVYALEKPDFVIHAGDYHNWDPTETKNTLVNEQTFLAKIDKHILGNHGVLLQTNGHDEFMSLYEKDYEIFTIEGKKFLLTHSYEILDDSYREHYGEWTDFFNKIRPNREKLVQENHIDYVICGHTHIPKIYDEGKVKIINPGSLTKPKSPKVPRAYIIGTSSHDGFTFKIKKLPISSL
ncbi:MAG: YfcE family phosphodiesterase [Mycoplasmataceae bacterium]|nr:YfcE family phosphodiesterase [Mycoplasmataceae bacterium]